MGEQEYDPSDVVEVDELGNEVAPTEDIEETTQEQADTDTETAEGTPEADTETEPAEAKEEQPQDTLTEVFKELGLDKRYADPAEALRAIPDFRRYTDHVSKAYADQQRRLAAIEAAQEQQRPKPQPPDPDMIREQFDENPLEAFRQAGVVTADQLESVTQKIAQIERNEVLRSTSQLIESFDGLKDVASAYRLNGEPPAPGINRLWDEMENVLANEKPWLKSAGLEAALRECYPVAKARLDAQKRPTVAKVPDSDKAAANTSSGNKGGKRPLGKPNFAKMSDKEYEQYLMDSGQLTE